MEKLNESFSSSLQGKEVNQKQYHIPEETAEMGATIKNQKSEGIVIPTTSPFNSPIWPLRRQMDLGERQFTIENSTK